MSNQLCQICNINDIAQSYWNSRPLTIMLQSVCRDCYNVQNSLHAT